MIDSTRKTFFSPDDDCQIELIKFINTAKKSIRIADYSFNLEPLAEALVNKHTIGVDVSCVFDKSQSKGNTEIPEITMLRNAGVPLVIGTSEKHKIMHLKVCIVDEEWVLSGSYNFTSTAAEENNFFDIEHNPQRAQQFLKNWQEIHDFIEKNEPQNE